MGKRNVKETDPTKEEEPLTATSKPKKTRTRKIITENTPSPPSSSATRSAELATLDIPLVQSTLTPQPQSATLPTNNTNIPHIICTNSLIVISTQKLNKNQEYNQSHIDLLPKFLHLNGNSPIGYNIFNLPKFVAEFIHDQSWVRENGQFIDTRTNLPVKLFCLFKINSSHVFTVTSARIHPAAKLNGQFISEFNSDTINLQSVYNALVFAAAPSITSITLPEYLGNNDMVLFKIKDKQQPGQQVSPPIAFNATSIFSELNINSDINPTMFFRAPSIQSELQP
ncbi:hypothetical protein HDU76_007969, partial [Blyttiomyces sp. JEL0837]